MKAAMLRILATIVLATAAFASEPLYDLRGRVHPAGHVYVTLFGADKPFDTWTFTLDGRFRFHKLLPGTYTLAVVSRGRAEVRRTVEVGPGTGGSKRRVEVEIELSPAVIDLVEVRRAHTVSARVLAIPGRALHDYDEARKALSRRDADAAVRHFERAVEAAPQFSAAWNELGTVAYQTRNFTRAEECFKRALNEDPHAYEPLVNLGGVEVTLRKTERALDYNIQAVLERPQDALAQAQLGMAYIQAGNDDLALKHLGIARGLDPAHFTHPQLLMAEIHVRRKDRAAAADDLDDFLKLHPDWPNTAAIRQIVARLRQ
jgi:tetratricopeptide (TPR) repeat protein